MVSHCFVSGQPVTTKPRDMQLPETHLINDRNDINRKELAKREDWCMETLDGGYCVSRLVSLKGIMSGVETL